MKLYFIRHGKAGYDAPTDEARPLTDVGILQAKNNGVFLKNLGIQPTKIYSSPRLRAHQTAQHIGIALNSTPEINDACNFDFSLEKALELASNYNEGDEIFFVGHNPSMSEVVTELTGAMVEMKPCAIACVQIMNPTYRPQAILNWFIKPKIVSAMLSS